MTDYSELDDLPVWKTPLELGLEVARRLREKSGEIDRLKAENERLIRRAKLLHDATIVLRNGMGGHGHWDDSMRRGAGCPVCIAQQKARDEATRLIGEAVGAATSPGATESVESIRGDLLRDLCQRVELLEAKFDHPVLVAMMDAGATEGRADA